MNKIIIYIQHNQKRVFKTCICTAVRSLRYHCRVHKGRNLADFLQQSGSVTWNKRGETQPATFGIVHQSVISDLIRDALKSCINFISVSALFKHVYTGCTLLEIRLFHICALYMYHWG